MTTRETTSGADAVEAIHRGTAIYTAAPEIERLLDEIGWPTAGGTLLDPACGDGNMIVAAMRSLRPAPGDITAAGRVTGIEFHPPSAERAKERISHVLVDLGWDADEADRMAASSVMTRDFLLDRPDGKWDIILANPPYWRRKNLPQSYAAELDGIIPQHARGDLLHAYMNTMLTVLKDGGRMALVTSDRWLLNSGAAGVRNEVGGRLGISFLQRLDAGSAFHRPKERAKGKPPRVHAVSMVLAAGGDPLGIEPYQVDPIPEVEGVPLADLVDIRLAPWLGPDGTFTVGPDSGLPREVLVPCVEPTDIEPSCDCIGPTRRWAIMTGDVEPPAAVLEHLDRHLHLMPPRGRRRVRWLPPERFDGRLPLASDAILVPRIARRLRAVHLPAGHLPSNHSLVVASGMPAARLKAILDDHRVQAQADAMALRLEDGHRSYTATLLRRLIVPHDLLEEIHLAA